VIKKLKNKKIPDNIITIILHVIALAMGIVSIVLNIIGEPVDLIILAIGLTALGFAGLISIDKK
jgi:hypothetical protein